MALEKRAAAELLARRVAEVKVGTFVQASEKLTLAPCATASWLAGSRRGPSP